MLEWIIFVGMVINAKEDMNTRKRRRLGQKMERGDVEFAQKKILWNGEERIQIIVVLQGAIHDATNFWNLSRHKTRIIPKNV